MPATMRSTIVYDIEVAGFAWDEVDEITRGYLLEREHDTQARETVPERTALVPGLGKIVAIGMWLVGEDRGLLLQEGPDQDERTMEKVPGAKIFRGSERRILEKFWQTVTHKAQGQPSRLVTYNGRSYDGPMLMIRSAQLGLPAERDLVGYRYDIADHCDLQDVLTFMGSTYPRYSLDFWCRRFEIESPKGKIDGSQIARAYRQGRIDDIGEYCLRDVRATAELYSKLADTILPLLG